MGGKGRVGGGTIIIIGLLHDSKERSHSFTLWDLLVIKFCFWSNSDLRLLMQDDDDDDELMLNVLRCHLTY